MAKAAKATQAKEKEEAPEKEEGAPDQPLPLLDLSDAGVKKMIKAAKKRGYVTHEQINAVLPSEEVTSDQIEDVFAMQEVVKLIYVDQQIKQYILNLVRATREPAAYGMSELAPLIDYGASPRATIFLGTGARAVAFMQGRGYVTPQDVKDIAYDVLRHRVILSYEAEAEQKTSEDLLKTILNSVPVP